MSVWRRDTAVAADTQALQAFLGEFDFIAPLFTTYGITSLLVDCREHPGKYCDSEGPKSIHTFSKGEEVLEISIDNVFDEDSFVSNILQIVLVDYVPILLTYKELQQFEHSIKGKHNAFFGYFEAIGSQQHRAYIEKAYQHKDVFNFTISTETKVAEIFSQEKMGFPAAVWLMKCAEMSPDNASHCPYIRYYDHIDEERFTLFIDAIGKPYVHEHIGVGMDPFTQASLNVIYLYHTAESWEEAMEMADVLSREFSPGIGIVTINVDRPGTSKFADYNGPFPALAVKLVSEATPQFCNESFTTNYARKFILHRLSEYMNGKTLTFDPEKPPELLHDETLSYRDEVNRLEQVGTDDSEVGALAFDIRAVKPNTSRLTALTDANFEVILRDSTALMVLYHLRFDVRSQLIIHSYANASHLIDAKNHMAHVDCHDWKKVCDTANIQTYPRILVYSGSGEGVVYTGRTDPHSIAEAVTLLQKNTYIELTDVKQAEEFILGTYPTVEVRSPANLSILGLVDSEQHANEFRSLSRHMPGLAWFGLARGAVASQLIKTQPFSVPGCVVLRFNDNSVPQVQYTGKQFTHNALREFVRGQQFHAFPELSPRSYPVLLQQDKLLVILFAPESDRSSEEWVVMANMAASRVMYGDLVMTWMDITDPESVGSKTLRTYTYDTLPDDSPKLVAVSHKHGGVTIFSGPAFTQEAVGDWLRMVLMNKEQHNYKLRKDEWKPTKRGFDYLRMMDEGLSISDHDHVAVNVENHNTDSGDVEGEEYDVQEIGGDDYSAELFEGGDHLDRIADNKSEEMTDDEIHDAIVENKMKSWKNVMADVDHKGVQKKIHVAQKEMANFNRKMGDFVDENDIQMVDSKHESNHKKHDHDVPDEVNVENHEDDAGEVDGEEHDVQEIGGEDDSAESFEGGDDYDKIADDESEEMTDDETVENKMKSRKDMKDLDNGGFDDILYDLKNEEEMVMDGMRKGEQVNMMKMAKEKKGKFNDKMELLNDKVDEMDENVDHKVVQKKIQLAQKEMKNFNRKMDDFVRESTRGKDIRMVDSKSESKRKKHDHSEL